ncbi:MAG TPA: efflux RND transporter periplasmic adaptor subunit [Terriglobales bacterium]|nr:efflux RND transporter periplasmic adaptor subunit [Terriglobales bacterium]
MHRCLAAPVKLASLLVIPLLLVGCSSEPSTAEAANQQPATAQVRVVRAQIIPFERVVQATGSLLADEQADVGARVAGRLESFSVDIGHCVEKGDVLARIDSQELQFRVQQAEAALVQAEARLGIQRGANPGSIKPEDTAVAKQARAVLEEARMSRERTAELFRQGIVSRADMDAVVAEHNVADARYQESIEEVLNRRAVVVQRRSELSIARQDLADAQVRAPFGGCVQQRSANVGEYLNEGAPVVNLVRMDPLRLRLQVTERDAAAVKIGQKLTFRVEGDANAYPAVVKRISPAITAEGRVVFVEAEVKNQAGLRPGSFARADIVTSVDAKALAIPEQTIVTFAGVDKVRVAAEGKAVERDIELGRRRNGMVEVLSGLTEQDAVIADPKRVDIGQPVEATTR